MSMTYIGQIISSYKNSLPWGWHIGQQDIIWSDRSKTGQNLCKRCHYQVFTMSEKEKERCFLYFAHKNTLPRSIPDIPLDIKTDIQKFIIYQYRWKLISWEISFCKSEKKLHQIATLKTLGFFSEISVQILFFGSMQNLRALAHHASQNIPNLLHKCECSK